MLFSFGVAIFDMYLSHKVFGVRKVRADNLQATGEAPFCPARASGTTL